MSDFSYSSNVVDSTKLMKMTGAGLSEILANSESYLDSEAESKLLSTAIPHKTLGLGTEGMLGGSTTTITGYC